MWLNPQETADLLWLNSFTELIYFDPKTKQSYWSSWQNMTLYTPKYLLKTIYYSLFNSDLIYASQIWANPTLIILEKV